MIKQRDSRTQFSDTHDDENNFPIILFETMDSATGRHEGRVTDISDSGMGITCSQQLNVGQNINFLPNKLEWDLPPRGIVMWTFKDNNSFRAGIKFI